MNRFTKAEEKIAKKAVRITLEEVIKFVTEEVEPSEDKLRQANYNGLGFKNGFDYCKMILTSRLEEYIKDCNE